MKMQNLTPLKRTAALVSVLLALTLVGWNMGVAFAQAQDQAPQTPFQKEMRAEGMPKSMTRAFGANYWYIPYGIINENQGIDMVNALKALIEQGEPLPRLLKVPDGDGASDSNFLYRLRPGIEVRYEMGTGVSSSDMPMIIAKPEPGDTGANVLYMDGHVDYVPWGTFPVTKPLINALDSLDQTEAAAAKAREAQ